MARKPNKGGQTALQSLIDGSKTGKRPQRIYTPTEVVDVLQALWPEGIQCDPCSGPDSVVPAAVKIMPPDNGCAYEVVGRSLRHARQEPVIDTWPQRTYVNPEFVALRAWVHQFLESWECVLMTPVRSHRRWWRPVLHAPPEDPLLPGSAVCYLDPVKFVGFQEKFPAPLALCYRGERYDVWRKVTSHLGEVLP